MLLARCLLTRAPVSALCRAAVRRIAWHDIANPMSRLYPMGRAVVPVEHACETVHFGSAADALGCSPLAEYAAAARRRLPCER